MNPIVSNVVTAVATAAVVGVFAFVFGVFEKGSEASSAEHIRKVLREEMKTASGKTYGAALVDIGLELNTVSTTVGIIQTDVSDLEKSVLDLAGD